MTSVGTPRPGSCHRLYLGAYEHSRIRHFRYGSNFGETNPLEFPLANVTGIGVLADSEEVWDHRNYFPAGVGPMLLGGHIVMSRSNENLYLNNIERKIITFIIEGKSNKEIAGSIGLSVGTVKNYVSNLLKKYDFKNRMELAVYFIREEK